MPFISKIIKPIFLLVTLVFTTWGYALVPPVPAYKNPPDTWQATKIDGLPQASHKNGDAKVEIPNNILVLRIQFADQTFRSAPAHPDFLAHDEAFFNRWMLHLSDFFAEASHGAYTLDYTIYPQVISLPNTMAYYGEDSSDRIDWRLAQIIPDFLEQIDAEIDFNNFGGIIIFHAGQGQESDIDKLRTNQIWSTFLTRRNLQAYFEPNNNNYPGVLTNDGAVLTNVVIVPEDEFQDYFPVPPADNADMYLFSIYGVLAHQFGHLIGLPTLFDNDSSNGYSQGIGNWGLMGTGVWNGNGYVPAQLSAYSRYMLGWETPVLLTQSSLNNPVDHFLNHSPDAIRMYKIPITETEYFLVENRQQNPDGSLDPYSSQPSYSFKLLPEGEQQYYENYPLLPYFDFMTNRYSGCEWDFFLPGLGGPFPPGAAVLQDGSGILIWHIDENVIAENFTANFDYNRINANSSLKGVDLEEADGIQHLDTSAPDTYKYGSPFDSFRASNNDYFGNQYHNDLLSLPTSASNYGGIPFEIYDISASGNRMHFSLHTRWSLDASYQGDNAVSACAVDFNGDGETELFYPMPNGQLYLWENDVLASEFPLTRMGVAKYYVWDGNSLYIPMQQSTLSRLYQLNKYAPGYVYTQNQAHWASHPVDLGTKLALPLNRISSSNPDSYSSSSVVILDKDDNSIVTSVNFSGVICSNIVNFRDGLSLVYKDISGAHWLGSIEKDEWEITATSLSVPADSIIVGIFRAPIVPGSVNGELIVQCRNSVYVFNDDLQVLSGFPYSHNLVLATDNSHYSPLSIADVDGNGSLDILIGGDNDYLVLDYQGGRMNPTTTALSGNRDGIGSGLYATDIDADGKAELVGNFSMNRLCVWDNDYRMKGAYPVAFSERSRALPFTAKGNDDNWYLFSATDNGRLFRSPIGNAPLANPGLIWTSEYANLSRSASIDPSALPNQYLNAELFVPGQLYLYPNPLKSIYNQKLILNVMPTRDVSLELSIYDISGSLIYRQEAIARAYLRNLDIFNIPAHKLSSGVYIAVVKSDSESKRIKFGVEK